MVGARRTPSNIPDIALATWEDFAHIFSTTGVVYLTLAYAALYEISVDMWNSWLLRMPALEVLVLTTEPKVKGSFPAALIEALQLSAAQQPSTVESAMIECARSMRLKRVVFSKLLLTPGSAETVLSTLERRASAGIPLEHIISRDCFCTSAFGGDLEKRVGENGAVVIL